MTTPLKPEQLRAFFPQYGGQAAVLPPDDEEERPAPRAADTDVARFFPQYGAAAEPPAEPEEFRTLPDPRTLAPAAADASRMRGGETPETWDSGFGLIRDMGRQARGFVRRLTEPLAEQPPLPPPTAAQIALAIERDDPSLAAPPPPPEPEPRSPFGLGRRAAAEAPATIARDITQVGGVRPFLADVGKQSALQAAESIYATGIGLTDLLGADATAEEIREAQTIAREFIGPPRTTTGRVVGAGSRIATDIGQFVVPGETFAAGLPKLAAFLTRTATAAQRAGQAERAFRLARAADVVRRLVPQSTRGKVALDVATGAPIDAAMAASAPENSLAGGLGALLDSESLQAISEDKGLRTLVEVLVGATGATVVRTGADLLTGGVRDARGLTRAERQTQEALDAGLPVETASRAGAVAPAAEVPGSRAPFGQRIRRTIAGAADPGLVREVEDLREAVRRDPLTGAHNVRGDQDAVASAMTERRPGTRVVRFRGDLDNFKALNDALGHEAGDDALKAVRAGLEEATRSGDLISLARVGGDEWAVTVVTRPDADLAAIRDRMEAAVARQLEAAGVAEPVPGKRVGISIGFADAADAPTPRQLDAAADRAAKARKTERGISRPREAVPAALGRETHVILPDGQRVKARYALVDAASLRPSHDPFTFQPRPDYPAGVQPRRYEADRIAQGEIVRMGGQDFDPDLVLDATTRATDGPPIITPDGVVVSGNSRVLATVRHYAGAAASDIASPYAARVRRRAAGFGLGATPADVTRPVVVRLLDEPELVRDPQALAELGRAFNDVSTKAMDPVADAIARARRLREADRALAHFQDTIEPDQTLRDYLATRHGRTFLRALVEDGVIPRTEAAAFLAADGSVTEAGKGLLERVLAAAAVRDPAILASAPKALLRKLDTAVPALVQVSRIPGYDLAAPLGEALQLHRQLAATPHGSLDELLAQGRMFDGPPDPLVVAIARALELPKARLTAQIRTYARRASEAAAQRASGDLFGFEPEAPGDLIRNVFDPQSAEQRAARVGPSLPAPGRELPAAITSVGAAETGQPLAVTLLHGTGRVDPEAVYATKGTGPLLGHGRYSTPSRQFAAHFGPDVAEVAVALRNPLVLRTDADWDRLIEGAGWRFRNPFGLPAEEIRPLIPELRRHVETVLGHDGVVVDLARHAGTDRARTLGKLFGEDTVVEFHRPERAVVELAADEGALTPATPTSRGFVPRGEEQAEFLEAVEEAAPRMVSLPAAGQLKRPSSGVKAPPRSEIVKKLSEALQVPIRTGKMHNHRKGVLGIYKVRPQVIRSRVANDIEVISHEVGHHLQTLLFGPASYTPRGSLSNVPLTPWKDELGPLGKGISNEKLSEGLAEFFRRYLTNPTAAEEAAPRFFTFVERELGKQHPDVLALLHEVRADYAVWLEAGGRSRLRAQVNLQERPDLGTIRDQWTRTRTAVIDDMAWVERAQDDILKGKTPDLEEDAILLARLARGSAGVADEFIEGKARRFGDLTPAGPGLREVMRPVRRQIADFRDYAVARRAIELDERGIESGIARADADQVLAETSSPLFEETFAALQQWNRHLLAYLRDSGALSAEAYALIVEKNKAYLPFLRVMDDVAKGPKPGAGRSRFGEIWSPVKRIRGSGREIVDPFESLIKQAHLYTATAARQQVSNALARLAQHPGAGGWIEKVPVPQIKVASVNGSQLLDQLVKDGAETETLTRLFSEMGIDLDDPEVGARLALEWLGIYRAGDYLGKENMISVLAPNGQRVWYEVHPELYRALMGLSDTQLEGWLKMLAIPARTLRAGATLSPEFLGRNPIRDQLHALVVSEYGYVPVLDLARGIFHIVSGSELYGLWRASGAKGSGLIGLDRSSLRRTFRESVASGGHVPHVVKNPLEALRAVSELMENATRVGEFARGVATEGTSRAGLLRSAGASREITDFSRHGASLKSLRAISAFWNARIQGYDRLGRAFRRHPVRTSARIAAGITLPSIGLYYVNRDDPDYWEVPQWQRDLFWLVPIGKDATGHTRFLRVPKPFELGVVFGTIPERLLEWADTEDPSAVTQSLEHFIGSEASGLVPWPVALMPLVENLANYDLFLSRPMVPQSLQDVEGRYQHGPNASELAKGLGRLLDYPPAKIDNLLYDWTGGLGRLASEGLDVAMDAARGGAPEGSRPRLGGGVEVPGVRGFLVRPTGSGSESVSLFYDQLADATEAHRTLRMLEREEHPDLEARGPELEARAERYQELRKVADELAKLRAEINVVRRDPGLSAREKGELILRIGQEMTALAKEAIGRETYADRVAGLR